MTLILFYFFLLLLFAVLFIVLRQNFFYYSIFLNICLLFLSNGFLKNFFFCFLFHRQVQWVTRFSKKGKLVVNFVLDDRHTWHEWVCFLNRTVLSRSDVQWFSPLCGNIVLGQLKGVCHWGYVLKFRSRIPLSLLLIILWCW